MPEVDTATLVGATTLRCHVFGEWSRRRDRGGRRLTASPGRGLDVRRAEGTGGAVADGRVRDGPGGPVHPPASGLVRSVRHVDPRLRTPAPGRGGQGSAGRVHVPARGSRPGPA